MGDLLDRGAAFLESQRHGRARGGRDDHWDFGHTGTGTQRQRVE